MRTIALPIGMETLENMGPQTPTELDLPLSRRSLSLCSGYLFLYENTEESTHLYRMEFWVEFDLLSYYKKRLLERYVINLNSKTNDTKIDRLEFFFMVYRETSVFHSSGKVAFLVDIFADMEALDFCLFFTLPSVSTCLTPFLSL